jgi:hypothetical protein
VATFVTALAASAAAELPFFVRLCTISAAIANIDIAMPFGVLPEGPTAQLSDADDRPFSHWLSPPSASPQRGVQEHMALLQRLHGEQTHMRRLRAVISAAEASFSRGAPTAALAAALEPRSPFEPSPPCPPADDDDEPASSSPAPQVRAIVPAIAHAYVACLGF